MSRYRFTILTIAFLCLLVVSPVVDHFRLVGIDFLLNVIVTFLLLSCVYALSHTRRQALITTVIIVPVIFLDWLDFVAGDTRLEILLDVYKISAFAYICFHLLRYALKAGVVDREKVAAAVNVYLFMGLIWRDLYSLTNLVIPDAFNSELLTQTDFLYYSFVTLSTLGYGDVLPVVGPAKALAYIEAIVGQLYLTILVARLVGLHIAYTGPECQDPD